MAFTIVLGFATEADRDDFVERILPRVRGHQVEAPTPEGEEGGLQRLGVAVTSQTAARDLCHQVVAFLTRSKNDRVELFWTGVDGQPHVGEVTGSSPRDAEFVAVRVGAAAKAHLDQEKAAASEEPTEQAAAG